jgi:hypothetical protein
MWRDWPKAKSFRLTPLLRDFSFYRRRERESVIPGQSLIIFRNPAAKIEAGQPV